jgi:high-affinity Fe2+/Pb2+ permease
LTKPEKEDIEPQPENIFSIVDRLVYQIDRTKKLIIGMIIAIIVAIPVSWHVSPLLLGMPYGYSFRLAGIITIVVAAVFFAIGARQWILLSDWTRKYKAYKEEQKKIDKKLDFDHGN